MDSVLKNRAEALEYIGPRKALLMSLIFQVCSDDSRLPKGFRTWRDRSSKGRLFQRQAALFCFGRKCMAPKDEWSFALWPDENSPIDAVFRRRAASGEMAFEFVQLKEVAPEAVNPKHSLQAVLDDLPTKYSSGDGFTVGIHVHHNTTTDLGALRLPKLSGGRIWLFGAGGEPPHDSFLVGDLLVEPVVCYFSYPRFQAGESITQWTGALDDAL